MLSATIDFIDFWLKALEHIFIERCNLYYHNMDLLFQKIPVKLPTQPSLKEERKPLSHAIVGGWYMDKLGQKLLPLKKSKSSKKHQKRKGKNKEKTNRG